MPDEITVCCLFTGAERALGGLAGGDVGRQRPRTGAHRADVRILLVQFHASCARHSRRRLRRHPRHLPRSRHAHHLANPKGATGLLCQSKWSTAQLTESMERRHDHLLQCDIVPSAACLQTLLVPGTLCEGNRQSIGSQWKGPSADYQCFAVLSGLSHSIVLSRHAWVLHMTLWC